MFEKAIALIVLLACIVVAVHMALPAAKRRWMEERGRRAWLKVQRAWYWAAGWRQRREMHKYAQAEADAAIKRARRGSQMVEGEWDGNVYRPKSFDGKKRDKRDLH
ncbi:hypothetical protein [Pelomonas sp. KK5]|uniref:hypothetical protein n=1 Tax=Pelomonas sp. KK5 TaxID=1855730 RepID=UPI00097C56DD|nr:hypothetical protein [Pelomonas sp. KK5]